MTTQLYLHVADVEIFPDVGRDDVPELLQIWQRQEVGQVPVTTLNVFVDPKVGEFHLILSSF